MPRLQIKLEERVPDCSPQSFTMDPSHLSIDPHTDNSLLYHQSNHNYCGIPFAKSLRRRGTGISSPGFNGLSSLSSPLTSAPQTPSPKSPASPPRPHIPRPPNAFMIYRSELIKNRTIPLNVEHRQQNISRLAGECWNLLSPEEKERYHKKAAEVLLEHQRLNPNYKFTPAPRGSRRAKARIQAEAVTEDSQRIRSIREQYTNVLGPSLVAARRRKRKAAKDKTRLEINPDLTFSGSSSPGSPSSSVTVSSDDYPPSLLSSSPFPQVSLPRRPSTSLGFNPCTASQEQIFGPSLNLPRPYLADGLSTPYRGLDIAVPPGGVHDAPLFSQFNLHPVLPFNFETYSLYGPLPVHLNPFIGHDSPDMLGGPFTHPFGSSADEAQCGSIAGQQFSLSLRGPCEVSPLYTSETILHQGQSHASKAWPLLNNPSDDLNYAVERQIFNATLPVLPSSASP